MAVDAARPGRLRVLVLARAFPNAALPTQGLWVDRLVQAAVPFADPVVISSVARVLPGVPIREWRDLARVPPASRRGSVEVLHPRVWGGLVHSTHGIDAALAWRAVRTAARRLHAQRAIDVIHAHFIYPDGVLAARLGRELGIPVVTTEHANWRPWLDDAPRVRRQVLEALPAIGVVTAVSEAARRTIEEVAGGAVRTALLPNVLDDGAFRHAGIGPRVPGRVLFVGMMRHVKGLDVLVRAMPRLIERLPDAHLRVVGSSLNRSNRLDAESAEALARSLGLAPRVQFVGHRDPPAVAEEMRQASAVAVPSRRESFSAVTIEALACGTPVVATRCGGPEELMDEGCGHLVPVEDPDALADALADVLRNPGRYEPEALRSRVLPRYGHAASTARLRELYSAVSPTAR